MWVACCYATVAADHKRDMLVPVYQLNQKNQKPSQNFPSYSSYQKCMLEFSPVMNRDFKDSYRDMVLCIGNPGVLGLNGLTEDILLPVLGTREC
jgi:hypothetical protein